MLLHDLGTDRNAFARSDAAVRPDLQDQLVVVCDLSDTRVLNCEVALAFILVFINGLFSDLKSIRSPPGKKKILIFYPYLP